MRQALDEAEALRARFDGGGQWIAPAPADPLEVVSTTGSGDPRAAAEEWMRADLARTADLAAGPLVRHVLIRHSEQGCLLYLRHHHAVLDGFGQALHWRRLSELYGALAAGEAPPPARGAPLRDLLAEDAAYAASDAWRRDRDYWLGLLADRPGTPGPPPGARPAAARTVLRRTAELEAGEAARLLDVAQRLGTTAPAVLVAAVAAYQHRVSGHERVLLSIPVPARMTRASRGTPAMLANQLPLLVDAGGGPTFAGLVARVTGQLADLLRHQRYRGEELHRDLGLSGTSEQLGDPTVNVMTSLTGPSFAGVPSTPRFLSAGPVRGLSLNFFIDPEGPGAGLVLDADAGRHTPAALEAVERHLRTLLGSALRDFGTPVAGLDLMRADERRAVLEAGQGPARDYDLGHCLHELVEAQAERTPDRTAVQVEGASLTYSELTDRARRLAAHLRRLGAGRGQVVGVHDERSLELVVELLAVLMAGAAYLPLDPELPAARLAFQIGDAGVALVLSRSHLAGRLAGGGAEVVAVDEVLPALPPAGPPPPEATPEDPAYLIYTSGSTGQPKGVEVPHRGVVNRLLWMQEEYGLGAGDCVLQKTPYTFDVSVWELFWPLLAGARLHLAEPGAHRDPRALAAAIRRHRVSTVHFVPTMLDLFLAEPSAAGLASLRRVIASGEALNPETVERFHATYPDGPRLHNLYGPTEASIDVTYWECRREDAGGTIPIGRPVANTSVHVLGPGGEPVPFGVPGELHIGGVQVASGYRNRPRLTGERFVPNPFGPGRLYRTGDLALLRGDGVVEYLGRLDQQVKVRGFRVEPGEVEAVLLAHPAVAQAVVTAPRAADGQHKLIAHVVVSSSASAGPDGLLAMLRERLPEYMVPARVLVRADLPRLTSGKVDRKALAGLEALDAPAAGAPAPPATEAERLVHDAWCEVLGRETVDTGTSFFALGGDSISSIRMRVALERRGHTVPVAELFASPTVRELARRIRPLDPAAADRRTEPFAMVKPSDRELMPAGVEDAYPLGSLQSGMLFHAGYEEGTSVYRVVTSLHLALPFDEGLLRRSLAAVLRRHPALRTSFHLTGFSEPLQLVHTGVPVPLEVRDDLPDGDSRRRAEAMARWAETAKRQVFDPAVPPLLAFTAHRAGGGSFWLSAVEHHAVIDGWSDMAMMDEVVARYRAAVAGEELWLPEVASSYHRFVAAERRAVQSPGHRAFWAEELAGAEPAPLPRASSLARRGRADHRRFEVPVAPATARRVAEAARRAQLPLKSLLAAAHVGVLDLVCGADEVLTGVVSHARLDEDGGDEVIGLFLNTLPLRARVGGATWLELARAVHAHEARTAPHRAYPYGQMVRDHGGLALDSYVNFMDFHQRGGRHEVVLEGFGVAETDFALAVDFLVDPLRGRLAVWLDCDVAVLDAAFCERLRGWYARALEAVAADPAARVRAAELRDAGELARERSWNATARAYDAEATVGELVARQARATPDALAVVHGPDRLTYAELDARANRLAGLLRARGAGLGGRVGVHVGRSADLVVALLAVLRSGAAYVPLDPGFPAERLRLVAADAALDCLVSGGEPPAGVAARATVRLDAGADAAAVARMPATPPEEAAGPEDPVYVMYTSGSTGRPKGTVLLHRNVANFFAGMDDRVGAGPGDVVLALTSVSFDISVLELLWPLARGATVVVAGERMVERLAPAAGPDSLASLCLRHRPTLLQATPSFLAAVATEAEALAALGGLRALLVGGEAFPAGLAQQLLAALPSVRVLNMYGPTETTIWSTVHELDRDRDAHTDVLPIGRPVANTVLRVVTPDGREAPVGVAGELWIGGDGVAAGYLGQPELTAERFVRGADGSRWYRTGDRARWRDGGVVEFLGRVDRQVKVSGHRVELDEVESVLSRHPRVASVAVTASRRPGGTTELVAYVAPAGGAAGAEAAGAHLGHWREVWERAYADTRAAGSQDERDFAGWLSSYSGAPIPAGEMREWLRHTVERAAALGARRVVEAGVGVGLLLRGLALRAESYHGLDVSPSALAAAEAAAAGLPQGRARLEQGDALALAGLPAASADLVVLNSVVQYFPSAGYLAAVLREAVRVAGPAGAVLVGDVRDLDLLDAFHAHVQVCRAPALAPAGEVRAAAERARAEERELCVAPGFFTDFAAGAPVGSVRVELKRGRHANELTRFRYDAVLLGRDRAAAPATGGLDTRWAPPAGGGPGTGALEELLDQAPPDRPVTVGGIPNRRLVPPLAALRLLRGEHRPGTTAWDLQRDLWAHDGSEAVDPEAAYLLGARHGRATHLRPAASGDPGSFDAHFDAKEG